MTGEGQSFREIMDRIGKGLDARTVFGEPQQVDGSTIIPVARIRYGGGGGAGGGEGEPAAGEAAPRQGEGMGMRFGVSAEPVGVVRVAHDTVEWVPVSDTRRLVLVWSIVSGFLLIMAARRLFPR